MVGPTRFSTILPDVATFAEQGYNLDFLRGNFGVFVPAGVSRAIVQSLNGEVNRLLAQPAFVEKYIAVLGMDPAGGTPEDYAAFLKNDRNTAARVAKGKVFIGNAGAEFPPFRGYVAAFDVNTGKELWRFYTTPGDPSKGFENKAMEAAAKTWGGEWWKQGGGGTVWDSIVYDPELKLVYLGVGNGGPWVQAYRSPGGGDNLFLASIVAVKADTGEYVWHYQEAPGDQWDYTATQPMMLADLKIDGRLRKVIMQAPKNGFFYVLDRATGELLSATKFAPNYWASHVDLRTGRPVINPAAYYDLDPVLMTPAPPGAHNWNPMSFSPLTGLVYFPVQEVWLPYSRDPGFAPTEGRQFRSNTGWGGTLGEAGRVATELGNARGHAWLTAWDPVRQREAWRVEYPSRGSGGTLATAGDLVFAGGGNNEFIAYRADNGERVWSFDAQTGVAAGPVSYELDGVQYIAVAAGRGLQPYYQPNYSRLLVFKRGGTASLPLAATYVPPPLNPPASNASLCSMRGRSNMKATRPSGR